MKLTPDVLFGDHMVLQAKMPVTIWGEAEGEGKVTCLLLSQKGTEASASGEAKDGTFSVTLPPMEYGEHFVLSLRAEGFEIAFTDVSVGEVWLLCGQSNMSWPLGWCWNKTISELKYADEIAHCANDHIREAMVPEVELPAPIGKLNAIRPWRAFRPETVGEMSACGFFFAQKLHEKLGVPVGVLSSCRGAVSLPGWVRGGSWYNGMIAPIVKVRARGVLWYQGEGDPNGYAPRLADMIGQWREDFGLPGLCFHVIELPRFVQEMNWYLCREEDRKVCSLTDHCTWSTNIDTGMYIPSIAEGDLGNTDAIHPYQKKEVGFRAADAVCEAVYGIGHYPIPEVGKAYHRDGKTVLRFQDVGDGLFLRGTFGFEAGQGEALSPVTPTLDGVEIVLDGLFTRVRYGLYNKEGTLDPADSVCVFCRFGNEVYPARQFDLTL